MAKVKRQSGAASTATKERLRSAAVEVLASEGIRSATIRRIADTADCNSALISYHFGSLNELLLAALDVSSEARMTRYETALAEVTTIRQLRAVLRRLYHEDRQSGHVRVLAELVAGGLMDPPFGAQVARRVDPWVVLTEQTLRRAVPAALRRRLPIREVAYGIVAMFLGLELLGSLANDYGRADTTVDRLSKADVLKVAVR